MSAHLSNRSVTALREHMIEDMIVRGFTEDTRLAARENVRCAIEVA